MLQEMSVPNTYGRLDSFKGFASVPTRFCRGAIKDILGSFGENVWLDKWIDDVAEGECTCASVEGFSIEFVRVARVRRCWLPFSLGLCCFCIIVWRCLLPTATFNCLCLTSRVCASSTMMSASVSGFEGSLTLVTCSRWELKRDLLIKSRIVRLSQVVSQLDE